MDRIKLSKDVIVIIEPTKNGSETQLTLIAGPEPLFTKKCKSAQQVMETMKDYSELAKEN